MFVLPFTSDFIQAFYPENARHRMLWCTYTVLSSLADKAGIVYGFISRLSTPSFLYKDEINITIMLCSYSPPESKLSLFNLRQKHSTQDTVETYE